MLWQLQIGEIGGQDALRIERQPLRPTCSSLLCCRMPVAQGLAGHDRHERHSVGSRLVQSSNRGGLGLASGAPLGRIVHPDETA